MRTVVQLPSSFRRRKIADVEAHKQKLVRSARGFRRRLREISGFEGRVVHVHGNSTTEERQAAMNTFKEAGDAILINCKAVTEGIDFPDANTVYLGRGTTAAEAVQILGRVVRISAEDRERIKLGTLVPNADREGYTKCTALVCVGERLGSDPDRIRVREVLRTMQNYLKGEFEEYGTMGDFGFRSNRPKTDYDDDRNYTVEAIEGYSMSRRFRELMDRLCRLENVDPAIVLPEVFIIKGLLTKDGTTTTFDALLSPPNLAFAKLRSAVIDGRSLNDLNWIEALAMVIESAFRRDDNEKRVMGNLLWQRGRREGQRGWHYIASLDLSIRGMNLPFTWKHMARIIAQYELPIAISFCQIDTTLGKVGRAGTAGKVIATGSFTSKGKMSDAAVMPSAAAIVATANHAGASIIN